MKLFLLILIVSGLSSCSLIPELDNLGPDLGIRVSTPKEAFHFVITHIKGNNQIDHFLPAKTLSNGYGSCVDRSLLALKILHDSGIDGQLVYSLHPVISGHAWVKIGGAEYDPGFENGEFGNDAADYKDDGDKHYLNYHAIVNSAWFLRIKLD